MKLRTANFRLIKEQLTILAVVSVVLWFVRRSSPQTRGQMRVWRQLQFISCVRSWVSVKWHKASRLIIDCAYYVRVLPANVSATGMCWSATVLMNTLWNGSLDRWVKWTIAAVLHWTGKGRRSGGVTQNRSSTLTYERCYCWINSISNHFTRAIYLHKGLVLHTSYWIRFNHLPPLK